MYLLKNFFEQIVFFRKVSKYTDLNNTLISKIHRGYEKKFEIRLGLLLGLYGINIKYFYYIIIIKSMNTFI